MDGILWKRHRCWSVSYTHLDVYKRQERNGMTLIAVVLNGHQTHYSDTKTLLDFGFDNFQSLRVSDYETKYTSITVSYTHLAPMPWPNMYPAPVRRLQN